MIVETLKTPANERICQCYWKSIISNVTICYQFFKSIKNVCNWNDIERVAIQITKLKTLVNLLKNYVSNQWNEFDTEITLTNTDCVFGFVFIYVCVTVTSIWLKMPFKLKKIYKEKFDIATDSKPCRNKTKYTHINYVDLNSKPFRLKSIKIAEIGNWLSKLLFSLNTHVIEKQLANSII